MKSTTPVGSGRVARLHRPPSELQLRIVEELKEQGYPCQWEGRGWMYEELHFQGLDRMDYSGPLCEVWIEFSDPYRLSGARLQVNCPNPYRGKVRTLYLLAFEHVAGVSI